MLSDLTLATELDFLASLARAVCNGAAAFASLVQDGLPTITISSGVVLPDLADDDPFLVLALDESKPLVISNASVDSRTCGHPSVLREGGIKFYCGISMGRISSKIRGVLCILDTTPRTLPAASSAARFSA